MITFLFLSGAVTLCGAVAFIFGLFNAPEGYEDESGFHIVWANNSPEIPDIACVWGSAAA